MPGISQAELVTPEEVQAIRSEAKAPQTDIGHHMFFVILLLISLCALSFLLGFAEVVNAFKPEA